MEKFFGAICMIAYCVYGFLMVAVVIRINERRKKIEIQARGLGLRPVAVEAVNLIFVPVTIGYVGHVPYDWLIPVVIAGPWLGVGLLRLCMLIDERRIARLIKRSH